MSPYDRLCYFWGQAFAKLDQAVTDGINLDEMPWCCRNDSPVMLFHARVLRALSDKGLRHATVETWVMAEVPTAVLGRGDWVQLFSEIGFTVDGEPG